MNQFISGVREGFSHYYIPTKLHVRATFRNLISFEAFRAICLLVALATVPMVFLIQFTPSSATPFEAPAATVATLKVKPFYTPTETNCPQLDDKKTTPHLISIPGASIKNNCLETIGIDSDGVLGDPQDIWNNIGYWLNPPAVYVKPNISIFTCHTSFNPERAAICDGLTRLAVSDTVIIELNSGQKLTYAVQDIKTTAKDQVDMNEFVSPIEFGRKSLSIMTCTGQYDTQTGDASHRLSIRAVLIN